MAKHPVKKPRKPRKPRKKTMITELIDRTKNGEDASDVYLSMVNEGYWSEIPLFLHTPVSLLT